ncbi:1-aminocyclopropane-1-carboxylate deaminase [Flavobacteriaceae bacterium MAR_2010_188]|nr:1-aminocyclopropane-1-carboxylate deaminase [Flavobacteriaceae bacterium MAR_2010_188]
MIKFDESKSVLQELRIENKQNIKLFIKREDLINPEISGNKYRKLKYNLSEAKSQNQTTLLTFGGAFSNHIAAVSAAGKIFGFKTIGIIRGEELSAKVNENSTLKYAKFNGMILKFISREDYRSKETDDFQNKLKQEFGDFYMLPEGGTNNLAVKGCEEILSSAEIDFDVICCSVGTGGTMAGLINCSKPRQQVLGFPALKGDFLKTDIAKFVNQKNWKLITESHFGGYAKINSELIGFINCFSKRFKIQLDPIYTGKMMFGLLNLIENGYFKDNISIVAIHSGGLQGIEGMNQKLKNKNLPLIQ